MRGSQRVGQDLQPTKRGARRRRRPPFVWPVGVPARSPAPSLLTEPVGSTPCSSQTTCRGC